LWQRYGATFTQPFTASDLFGNATGQLALRAEGLLAAMVIAGIEREEFEAITRKEQIIVAEMNRSQAGTPPEEEISGRETETSVPPD